MADRPRLRPITELNGLPANEFAAALTPLFEAAQPLAEALFLVRPFASYAALIERAELVAAALPEDERIAVVNAHLRIGEDAARVSALSFDEQGYATEASTAAEDLARVYAQLAELNQEYERRFGFRFVVFVNKRPKAAILEVLHERLSNPRLEELARSLQAMFLIARDRLVSLSAQTAGSIQPMEPQSDTAYLAVLDELRRGALSMYGEERCAEAGLQTALGVAARAVWRLSQEPLEPLGNEPLPTHG